MGIEDVCNFGRGGREGIFVHACATCHTLPSSQKKNVAVVRLHVTPLAPRATHSKFRRVSIIGKRSSSYLPSSSSASWDAEEEEEGQRRSLAARVNTGERERERERERNSLPFASEPAGEENSPPGQRRASSPPPLPPTEHFSPDTSGLHVEDMDVPM